MFLTGRNGTVLLYAMQHANAVKSGRLFQSLFYCEPVMMIQAESLELAPTVTFDRGHEPDTRARDQYSRSQYFATKALVPTSTHREYLWSFSSRATELGRQPQMNSTFPVPAGLFWIQPDTDAASLAVVVASMLAQEHMAATMQSNVLKSVFLQSQCTVPLAISQRFVLTDFRCQSLLPFNHCPLACTVSQVLRSEFVPARANEQPVIVVLPPQNLGLSVRQ
eukprot:3616407-Amphidinium_carterae.1